ncbi:MAG: helix-turn-helix transcriptional regulator [Firmicutes bacterium]|jgi:DNA-binding HxlR family transcriptional regulator|nr:helix-turn-helix transcriptional regulator [Bacillota bacterium]
MCKVSEKAYICPLALSVDVLGGKWKMQIMWHLKDDILRYTELKKKLSKISQKILTLNLRELEEAGLVSRKIYPVSPPKVEYSLTEYGETIIPILDAIHMWGKDYSEEFGVDVEAAEEIPMLKYA